MKPKSGGKPKGSPKTGGRAKGTPNKSTKELHELADKLGVNPFEVLLRFAANDWEGLGYLKAEISRETSSGDVTYEPTIAPKLRKEAAASACEYLYPKRKAVEHTGPDGESVVIAGFKIDLEERKKAIKGSK